MRRQREPSPTYAEATAHKPGATRAEAESGTSLLNAAGNLAIQRLLAPGDTPQIGPAENDLEREAARNTRHLVPQGPLTGTTGQSGAAWSGPLPESVRHHYEPRLGASLSAVRIHQGPWADLATRSLGTRAFTLGSDVVFGNGQFAPQTAAGNHLLAHELVHVVQQTGGRAPRQVQRDPPEQRIARHTSLGRLDTRSLGAELARMLPLFAIEVETVIRAVPWASRDNVSAALVNAASDGQLRASGIELLRFLRAQLLDVWTSDRERQLAERLERLMAGDAAARLTVKAEPPVSASESNLWHTVTNFGHAFLELRENPEAVPVVRGFYAESYGRPSGARGSSAQLDDDIALVAGDDVPGMVRDEPNHPWTARLEYRIDSAGYDRARELVEGMRAHPPSYNLYSFNCVHFVRYIAAAAGVTIPNLLLIDDPVDLAEHLLGEGGEVEGHATPEWRHYREGPSFEAAIPHTL